MPIEAQLEEIQRFLDGAIHDLRAAARGINTFVELLGQTGTRQLESGPDPALQGILVSVARMNSILAGVSSYSLALQHAHYSLARIPVEHLVHSVLKSLEEPIRQAGAKITYDALPTIAGDRERLVDLFRILIDNALRYGKVTPVQIDIKVRREADDWLFSVQDNGPGVDHKYWRQVFLPFRRLHGYEIPGAGLGLAIAQKIVEGHRGRIWIDSAAGSGATFCFTLPAADDNQTRSTTGIQT